MAKAREVAGLDCADPFALAAARTIEVRAAEVMEHSQGILDLAEIERVHDMRVATRRLRAAMEIFEPCFPRKRFRRALREVKRVADLLGERRDRDVAIEALEEFANGIGARERPGVKVMIAAFRAEQLEANELLAEELTEARLMALLERLLELSVAARERAGIDAPPEPGAGIPA